MPIPRLTNTLAALLNPRAKKLDIELGSAVIWIDNTVRYQLYGEEAEEEYAMLVPPSGSTIRLPSTRGSGGEDVYTVALFHQLECLGIIRREYANHASTKLGEHCLNYLRESILCLADTRLESVRSALPPNIVSLAGDYQCKDWTAVYEAAAKQQ